MSDTGVNIAITTSANTRGAEAATRSLNTLEAEVRELTQQMRLMAVDSEVFNQNRLRLSALNDEIDTLRRTKDAGSKSAANFGQAILQGSRAVQDFSAVGIPGMVNNVEGIASAFGMSAKAAGGFTLAFVAVEVLMKNWDTWFGPEKAEQAKAFWSAVTPDEAYATRLREAAELNERIADSITRAGEARQKEMEQLTALSELWKGITQTPEERGDLPPLPGMAGPSKQTAAAQEKYATEAAKAIQADEAFKAQQARVDAMNRISSFDERVKFANERDLRELAGLDTSFDEAGGPNSPEAMKQAEEIRARMKRRREEMAAQIQAVPGLTDGLTGDPEKDRETLQQRAQQERDRLNDLNNQRLAAARDAQAAGQDFRNMQERDTQGAAAGAFRDLGLPPGPGQFSGADERGGLTAGLQRLQEQRTASQAAAQQLTQATESVANDQAAMQQNLTTTLSLMSSVLKELNAGLSQVRGEVATLRDTTRS